MKITKKEKEKIQGWISNYFADVIMPVCKLVGYRVFVELSTSGGRDKTFSIKVNFPYRSVTLYIQTGGIELYRAKNYQAIRTTLFHEAFHIIHWTYKEYAKARFSQEETMDEMEENLADLFSMIVEDLYVLSQKNETKNNNKPF